MIVLAILGYVLLFLLVILLTVLFTPIEYFASGSNYEDASIGARVTWFFRGLQILFSKQPEHNAEFSVEALGFTIKPTHKAGKKEQKHKKDKEEKKKRKRSKNKRQIGMEFIEQGISSAKELLTYIKPDIFEAEGLYGFDDPYYTGITCALINTLMPYGDGFKVSLTPVFDEAVLKGRFKIQGRIMLAVIVWIGLKFVLSSPVRKILFKSNKERKKKVYVNQC